MLLTVCICKYEDAARRPLIEKIWPNKVLFPDSVGKLSYFIGLYTYITRDNGESWEGPHLISDSYIIRGQCVELPDGTVLAPAYDVLDKSGTTQAAVFASRDRGRTWAPYAFLSGPQSEGHSADEPTLVRTASGRIVAFIRTPHGMYYCHSNDDGLNFTEPTATDFPASVPYHALRLPDGRVWLSYGHRAEPYGIRAVILDSDCGDISRENELILRDDGVSLDLSYTSAALLPDGDILTVYYHCTRESNEQRHIAGTVVRAS